MFGKQYAQLSKEPDHKELPLCTCVLLLNVSKSHCPYMWNGVTVLVKSQRDNLCQVFGAVTDSFKLIVAEKLQRIEREASGNKTHSY